MTTETRRPPPRAMSRSCTRAPGRAKAEREEDMRVDATFEQAVQVLTRPVRMRYVRQPAGRIGAA